MLFTYENDPVCVTQTVSNSLFKKDFHKYM